MNESLVLIGIPQSTVDVLAAIAKKTGMSMTEVLSQALLEKAKKHLTDADLPRRR